MDIPLAWQERAQPILASLAPPRRRAYELARAGTHRYTDVPHLVRALLEDAHVKRAVVACGADPEEVEAVVEGTIDDQPEKRFWHFGAPSEHRELLAVYERALLHALSAELDRVRPVALLVRALAHRPESVLSARLDALDVDALRLMRFDAHGRTTDAPFRDGRGPARVVLLDDPYTTMEAVVEILQRWLALGSEDAIRVMRAVHEGGREGVVFPSWDEARRRAEAARADARERGFPLELELEPA